SNPEASALRRADEAPPDTSDHATLAEFYYKRGRAAEEIGRAKQWIDDLTKALEYAHRAILPPRHAIFSALAQAEANVGDYSRVIELRRQAIEAAPSLGTRLALYFTLTVEYVYRGDLRAAEAALAETTRLFHESIRTDTSPSEWQLLTRPVSLAQAQAALLLARGKHAEAEALYRKGVAVLAGVGDSPGGGWWLDLQRMFLARSLIYQGRLLEAES